MNAPDVIAAPNGGSRVRYYAAARSGLCLIRMRICLRLSAAGQAGSLCPLPGSRLGNNAAMEFDRFTVALLVRRDDAPELDQGAENALQDAHMAHLADLHQAGHLLAAGPLLGEPGRAFRGLSILAADPDQARVLKEQDPAVRAGMFRVECLPWLIPAGAVTFARTRFPRSMAEAAGD